MNGCCPPIAVFARTSDEVAYVLDDKLFLAKVSPLHQFSTIRPLLLASYRSAYSLASNKLDTLAIASQGGLGIWKGPPGGEIRRIVSSKAIRTRFSQMPMAFRGRETLVFGDRLDVKTLDTRIGISSIRHYPGVRQAEDISEIAIDDDGDVLLGDTGGSLHRLVFDKSGQLKAAGSLAVGNEPISAICTIPGSKAFLAATEERAVFVVGGVHLNILFRVDYERMVICATQSTEAMLLALGTTTGIVIFEVTGTVQQPLRLLKFLRHREREPIFSLDFGNDGHHLVATTSTEVQLWDAREGELVSIL